MKAEFTIESIQNPGFTFTQPVVVSDRVRTLYFGSDGILDAYLSDVNKSMRRFVMSLCSRNILVEQVLYIDLKDE